MSPSKAIRLFCGCIFLILPAIARADSEFPVNVRTSLNQANPDIASDAEGNFIVVWNSYYQENSNEIRGRLFDADGGPLNGEIEINQAQGGNQKSPAAVMDGSGDFTVVWQGPGDDGNDIWGRRFDANGVAKDDEFIINSDRAGEQVAGDIAMNSSARTIVVWENASKDTICGQLFSPGGDKIGNELTISDTDGPCRYPAAALSDANRAVVAWVRDSATQSVHRIQFDADGNEPVTGSVKVSDPTNFNSLTRPAIAMDAAGNYIIAWDGHVSDHDQDDVYMRAFHWSGAGHYQFRINDGNDGAQRNPAAAVYDDGEFVLLWTGDSEEKQAESDIFGRRFVMNFESPEEPVGIGSEFRLNRYICEEQANVAMTGRSGGGFAAVWQSTGQDTSGEGVYARIGPVVGDADLSCDGFVDLFDYCIIARQWQKAGTCRTGDLINDNMVDCADLDAFCRQWLDYSYSCQQVNVDGGGGIDFKDFAGIAGQWKNNGPLSGDIDGNGVVDEYDLQWFIIHWAKVCGL